MDNPKPDRIAGMTRTEFDAQYKEFERKMILFEDGPTTTNFEQLTNAGIKLPEPESIADADITTKLWEVIAGLAQLRVFLDQTDHLSDRELYSRLWHDCLRVDTPAIDEIGFNTHVDLAMEDTDAYLKYYADEKDREFWAKDFPDDPMPDSADPPFNRDWLLPRPHYTFGPDAREWLRANPSPHAFATNRFQTTHEALKFVEDLHAAGATQVRIENIQFLPGDNWLPYADTLIVTPPEGDARRVLVEFIEEHGKPDEDAGQTFADRGQSSLRLWWD
jgi:hypothetical protein